MRLLDALQTHLIDQGLVRSPATPSSSLPPMWKQPAEGAIGPGQRKAPYMHPSMVLSCFLSGGRPTISYEGFWDAGRLVDIRIRCRGSGAAADAWDLERAIHAELGDRQNYSLGGLHIEESLRFVPLQLVTADADEGYDFLLQLIFFIRQQSYDA